MAARSRFYTVYTIVQVKSYFGIMVFITNVAMASGVRARVRFSKAIHIMATYSIDIIIDLLLKVKHMPASPASNFHYVQFPKS